jgi:phage-related protein
VTSRLKLVEFVASSKDDLSAFPIEVRRVMGQALFEAQQGLKHPAAKPLKGFGGASVLEVRDDFDRNTYRFIYTVKFAGVIYALHAFQKKSKSGVATPQADIELIKRRLAAAQAHYDADYKPKSPR